MTDKRRIGFVGTGIMGGHMARRLAEAGHQVVAWNRSPDKAVALRAYGVEPAGDIGEAGRGKDAVVVMVSDGPATDAVILGEGGLLGVMDRGATLIVMSSIPMETAAGQASRCAELGVLYLDAPVSGGEAGARDGTLAIMAGGDEAAFEAAGDIFRALGHATYLGPAGTGSLTKLANQVIVGNTIATVAEALLLAEKGGANPYGVLDALKGGFADSPILQNHGRRMLDGNYVPGGPCRLQLKDTRTANETAARFGLSLPLTELTGNHLASLVARGYSESDHAALYLELLQRNGLEDPSKSRS